MCLGDYIIPTKSVHDTLLKTNLDKSFKLAFPQVWSFLEESLPRVAPARVLPASSSSELPVGAPQTLHGLGAADPVQQLKSVMIKERNEHLLQNFEVFHGLSLRDLLGANDVAKQVVVTLTLIFTSLTRIWMDVATVSQQEVVVRMCRG